MKLSPMISFFKKTTLFFLKYCIHFGSVAIRALDRMMCFRAERVYYIPNSTGENNQALRDEVICRPALSSIVADEVYIKIKHGLSPSDHISGAQEPRVACGFCLGQCGCGTAARSQKVL